MTRNPKDFWTGLLYILFGSSAILIARDYGMGTGGRMGPAYFPNILGGLLIVIGAISVIRSFIAHGAPIGTFAFKGLAVGQRVGACIRHSRARRGIGGCYTYTRHNQRLCKQALSLGPDATHSGGAHDVLLSCVY